MARGNWKGKYVSRNCPFCNRSVITEYMVTDKISFLMCDNCNISADAGRSHFEAVDNWNYLVEKILEQKYFKVKVDKYIENRRS